MVRKCEQAVRAQAEERQGTRTDLQDNIPLKLAGGDSRDELAQMAEVGHSTYEHAAAVLDNAPAPMIEATRKKELSINAAYEVTKLPQNIQQEFTRIRQGEKPRKVVSGIKRQRKTHNKNTGNLLSKTLNVT